MTKSIPASYFVSVNPSVIGAGGNPLVLNGIALTNSSRVPIGSVWSAANQAAVAAFFGGSSTEAAAAAIYFLGFDDSNIKPGSMLFTQYNTAPVAGYLRGASLAAMTLAQLQALTGTLILTVDGTLKTSSTINLSAATSFSNAVTIILAAFTTPGFTIAFDSVSSAFVFTSVTTGANSSVSFASGTLAESLNLRLADAAVTSPGAVAAVPGAFMDAVAGVTQNWATFFTTFDPDGGAGNTLKQAFAAWTNAQNNRFAYIAWDPDLAPTVSNAAAASLGAILTASGSSGTCCIYAPSYDKAAFVSGAVASVDFTETNGSTNFAYRKQAGLSADVTDLTTYVNLKANGYNAYCAIAAANQGFQNFQDGRVTGKFKSLRAYINQIYLNNALQLAAFELEEAVRNLPQNDTGRSLVRAALLDPINAAINFGAIQPGVSLSASQIAEVNYAAGRKIDATLSALGWYLQVLDPGSQVRALSGSPVINFFYTDGGSINLISMNSVDVQ